MHTGSSDIDPSTITHLIIAFLWSLLMIFLLTDCLCKNWRWHDSCSCILTWTNTFWCECWFVQLCCSILHWIAFGTTCKYSTLTNTLNKAHITVLIIYKMHIVHLSINSRDDRREKGREKSYSHIFLNWKHVDLIQATHHNVAWYSMPIVWELVSPTMVLCWK